MIFCSSNGFLFIEWFLVVSIERHVKYIFGSNIFLVKYIYFFSNIFWSNMIFGQIYFLSNIFWVKHSLCQIYFWSNIFLWNTFLVKHIYFCQIYILSNIFRSNLHIFLSNIYFVWIYILWNIYFIEHIFVEWNLNWWNGFLVGVEHNYLIPFWRAILVCTTLFTYRYAIVLTLLDFYYNVRRSQFVYRVWQTEAFSPASSIGSVSTEYYNYYSSDVRL